jgi:chromosome segregation ATPase
MSDDTSPNPESPDGDEGSQGAPDGDPKAKTKDEFVPKSELDKAAKRRDQATERARKAEERAAELEAKVNSFDERLKELDDLKRKAEDDDAVKRGDIEKLRKSAQDREAELATRIAELQASLERTKAEARTEVDGLKNTYLLEAEVMRVLSETTTDPELVWMALGQNFELAEDENGKLRPRVKNDTRDIKTFVERKLEDSNRAILLKSQRKAGAGTEQTSAKESSSVTKFKSLEEINAMPDKGAKYFRENPDAAAAALSGIKLS